MDPSKYGVHRTHCCVIHGCKYGYEDCPVVNEVITQEYPCEYCASIDSYYGPHTDKRVGLYKHFKGKVYELFEIAKDSGTLEDVAVYRDKDNNVWTRPWKEFDDIHPDKNVKRFQRIGHET
jgi:hypothetical protein